MTSEKLHDALSLLPADLVAETDALRTQAKKPQVHWQRWAAMAACLAVVLLAGTMFSRLFGPKGSSKTTAAVDQFQMFVAEAPDRENAAPALGEAKADRPDDDHTHAPADEPESANGTEDGYLWEHLRHRNAGRKRLHALRQRRRYADGHSGKSGL